MKNKSNDAWNLLKEKKEHGDIPPPDIIVLDAVMHDITESSNILKFIKDDQYLSKVPVVFYSGFDTEFIRSFADRADAIVEKPISWTELNNVIDIIIKLVRKS